MLIVDVVKGDGGVWTGSYHGGKHGPLQQQKSLFPPLSEKVAGNLSQDPSSHPLPLCFFSFLFPSLRSNLPFLGKQNLILLLLPGCIEQAQLSLWSDI